MKNAFKQVRPQLKKAMDIIGDESWGKGERKEWEEKENQVMEKVGATLPQWTRMKAEMHAVMISKTGGDARLLVRNAEDDGLFGYMRLHKWFMESSGRGMQQRIRAVHKPEPAKTEEEMFQKVERWEEEIRDIEKLPEARS